MKAIFEAYGCLKFEVEGDKLPSVMKEVGAIVDAIGHEACGKCDSEFTFPNVREVQGDTFWEIKCQKCGAVLQLGLHKEDQVLYKKRMKVDGKGKALKGEDGKALYLPNKGWLKWNPQTKQM